MQHQLDYNKWANEYKFPYRDLKNAERIKALEERLFTNEWALIEVRATRELQEKLYNALLHQFNQIKDRIVAFRNEHDGVSDEDAEILMDIEVCAIAAIRNFTQS